MIQFDEQIDPEMLGPDGTLDYKEEKEQINFIVVGPITDPAKRITGDMLSFVDRGVGYSFSFRLQ